MKTIVHINRHMIALNRKDGGSRPVYSVKVGRRGRPTYAQSVVMRGEVTLVDPRTAGTLPCGATVWCEVDGDVDLVDPMPFAKIVIDPLAATLAA